MEILILRPKKPQKVIDTQEKTKMPYFSLISTDPYTSTRPSGPSLCIKYNIYNFSKSRVHMSGVSEAWSGVSYFISAALL